MCLRQLYATGYGAGGRLGLGSQDSTPSPTLIPCLQCLKVTKVSVHAGGKHALALTCEGLVFSWGDGADGKLGHGNRL